MILGMQSETYTLKRQQMMDSQLRARGIRDERVLAAMGRVPRHEFVGENYREQAYEDHPIAIDEGQTLSQPYIVALMLEALALRQSDNVLEVGTGSGYQTALLCELVASVQTVERHPSLATTAEATLRRLGYSNFIAHIADGSEGMAQAAPYEAIAVAAAAPRIPDSLSAQLSETGRMVIPVGPPHSQELQLVRKLDGKLQISVVEGCRFVPLIGSEGYPEDW